MKVLKVLMVLMMFLVVGCDDDGAYWWPNFEANIRPFA